MAERLWFQQPVEGLFLRGLGPRLTPELVQVVRAQGIELANLRPAYPIEQVRGSLEALAPTLFPSATREQALREFGRIFLRGYAQTFIGSAMVKLMKVIGPRRTLQRMTANFRTGSNFIETRFTSLGPTEAEVWFNDGADMPEFFAGVVDQGSDFLALTRSTVELLPDTPPAFRLRVTWES